MYILWGLNLSACLPFYLKLGHWVPHWYTLGGYIIAFERGTMTWLHKRHPYHINDNLTSLLTTKTLYANVLKQNLVPYNYFPKQLEYIRM